MKVKKIEILVRVIADDSTPTEQLKELCEEAERLEKVDNYFSESASVLFGFTSFAMEGAPKIGTTFHVTTEKLLKGSAN